MCQMNHLQLLAVQLGQAPQDDVSARTAEQAGPGRAGSCLKLLVQNRGQVLGRAAPRAAAEGLQHALAPLLQRLALQQLSEVRNHGAGLIQVHRVDSLTVLQKQHS